MASRKKLIIITDKGEREYHLYSKNRIKYVDALNLIHNTDLKYNLTSDPPTPNDYASIYEAILRNPDEIPLYSNIISDNALISPSMTEEEIQSFFEQKKCFFTDFKENGESASKIIFRFCDGKMNPRILLAKLQVEKGLISEKDKARFERNVKKALGVGCYDNSPSNPEFTGFTKQVEGAVDTFLKWFHDGNEKLSQGKKLTVKVQDGANRPRQNLSCENAATYSLFKYTPHTISSRRPYGGGNYLFLRVFTQFFGVNSLSTGAPAKVIEFVNLFSISPVKYFEDPNLRLTTGCLDDVARRRYNLNPNVPDNYVFDLQNDLMTLGFSVGASKPDGWFGNKTKAGIVDFQKASLTSKRKINNVISDVRITHKGPVDGVVTFDVAKEIQLWIQNNYQRCLEFIKPPNGLEEIKKIFGDARFTLGSRDRYCNYKPKESWYNQCITTFELWFPVKQKIKCHRLIVPILQKTLYEIEASGLKDEIKKCNGCYCPRKKTSRSNEMSVHSWGIAIDFNYFPNQNIGDVYIHPDVVKIFKDNGFTWGGDFQHYYDPMHFQYCSGY